MGVKVHFLQGSFGLVLSSSADNSKFEIEPTMPVNEEMVQVVFDSAQRCRWTWRGLLRAHNGSTMRQQLLAQDSFYFSDETMSST